VGFADARLCILSGVVRSRSVPLRSTVAGLETVVSSGLGQGAQEHTHASCGQAHELFQAGRVQLDSSPEDHGDSIPGGGASWDIGYM